MSKKWTKRELDRLESLWMQGLTYKVIASKMKGRSMGSCAMKLNQLQKSGIIEGRNKKKGNKNNTEVVTTISNKKLGITDYERTRNTAGWPMYGSAEPFHWNTLGKDIPQDNSTTTAIEIQKTIEEIKRFLIAKNTQYGDSALAPIRIFSKSSKSEQLKVRIDDKLNRLVQGDASMENDEDVIKDLIGYLVLLLINLRDNS